MENNISSKNKCIADLDKGYLIDYYQRDYKWTTKHINTLFEDLLLKFEPAYEKNPIKNWESVVNKQAQGYDWYYLSTIITAQEEHNVNKYVVDGQQRLTTLCLILIALYHQSDEQMQKFLENNAILCKKDSSECKIFLIADDEKKDNEKKDNEKKDNEKKDNEKRSVVFTKLLENPDLIIPQYSKNNITIFNMYTNYDCIWSIIIKKLADKNKLHHFIAFFIYKVLLIDIQITKSIDIPMVFEVINDRGEKLRSYEILKGKLLAKVERQDKNTLKHINELWNKSIHMLLLNLKDEEEGIDQFFIRFLEARMKKLRHNFSSNVNQNNYHKFYQKFEEKLNINDADGVIQFVKITLPFYAELYIRWHDLAHYIIWDNGAVNQMRNDVVLFAMSLIAVNDTEKEDKIQKIVYLVERMYAIACLCMVKFDNASEILPNLNENKTIDEYQAIFDTALRKVIGETSSDCCGDDDDDDEKKSTPFVGEFYTYMQMKMKNLEYFAFKHYFLLRIEDLLRTEFTADKKWINQFIGETMKNISRAYHIEYILADNDENRSIFETLYLNDEAEVNKIQNRLGALTILKGSANSTSRNEYYKDKLERYKENERLVNNMLIKSESESESFTIRGKEFTPLVCGNVREFITEGIQKREEMFLEFARIIWDF